MVRTLALTTVVIAVLAGCGGSTGTTATTSQQGDAPGVVVRNKPLADIDQPLRDAAASARLVTYTSRSGVDDAYTHVTASIFVPKSNPPPGGFPVVVFGHETTGISPDCAPSLSPLLLNASGIVQTLLDAGYIVTVPDYQGLGNPTDKDLYYPYLDSTTAGYNMIDSVRAARTLFPQASASWAALGTVHGGQAAWAANELSDNYGSGMNLVGSASISPPADVIGLVDAATAGSLTTDQELSLSAFLAALKAAYGDDFNLDDYRRGVVQNNWDLLLGCRDSVHRANVAAQITPGDLRPDGPGAVTTLRNYLQKTNLPQAPAQAPMLVIYGGQDALTPPAWTARALDHACKMGDVVTIQLEPDKGRGQIDPVEAVAWIADRFRSLPALNDCESYTAAYTPPTPSAG
jgi:hypothetical protein